MNGDRFRASQTAAIAGWMLGWLLAGLGVALIVRHDDGIFICFLGLFLVGASRTEQHAAELRGSIAGTRVRDVTWFGVAHASGETEARTMLRQRLRMGGLGVVAVHDEDGRVTGYVSERQLVRARDGGKGHTPLKTLAVPADRVGRAELDEELSDALSRIQPRLPMVAVWDSDQLVGIVANDAVEERLAAGHDGLLVPASGGRPHPGSPVSTPASPAGRNGGCQPARNGTASRSRTSISRCSTGRARPSATSSTTSTRCRTASCRSCASGRCR
jgi:hypothetical protein